MHKIKLESIVRAVKTHRDHESNVLEETGISLVEGICLFEKLTRPKDTVNLVLGIKPGKISNIKPGWNSESDLYYQTKSPLECLMEGIIYKTF